MAATTNDNRWPRVVDFSTHFSGPLASRELVNLGADVIKVERPKHGDGNRAIGAQVAGASGVHHALSAGTRSIVLDRRSDSWASGVEALVATADVVIVGARPEDAADRGLDFEHLVRVKPDLVYCAVTGFGEDGPWSARPAHGLQPDLMAGVVSVRDQDGLPAIPDDYKAHGTALAGLWAALGVMSALLRRERSGGAQYVSISIWEAALAWMWREGVNDLNGLPQRPAFQALGSRYRLYSGSDGAAVLVCPIEEKFWVRFVDIVGLPAEWRSRGSWESGADYGSGRDDEVAAIAERIGTRPAAEWEDVLAEAGVPVALVRGVGDAYRSPQAAARGSVARIATPDGTVVEVPVPPLSVTTVAAGDDRSPAALAEAHRNRSAGLSAAPLLGEHTDQIMKEVGIDLTPASAEAAAADHRPHP